MNTATLRELGELTAEEVAGWNTKELAAAARRAVSLWRREQPRAAARVQRMQRLLLLPPPNAMALPRVAAVNGGGSSTHSSSSSSAAGGGGSSYFNGWNEMRTAVKESGRGRFGDTAAPTTPLPCDPVELTQATPAAALSAERRSTAEAEAAVFPAAAPAAAAMPILAVQRSPLPRRRLTGGVYGTSVVVDVEASPPPRAPSGPAGGEAGASRQRPAGGGFRLQGAVYLRLESGGSGLLAATASAAGGGVCRLWRGAAQGCRSDRHGHRAAGPRQGPSCRHCRTDHRREAVGASSRRRRRRSQLSPQLPPELRVAHTGRSAAFLHCAIEPSSQQWQQQ
ncbi:hypothetical protein Vretifemale_9246 [Volvox reticuliferus]|uniref:Uncharacterized protein n=1 Tax=Volvox reticuliferus TaxID=1737510 RepID=A0A8J4FQB7_9CHLO|nr:hypothetical protein Vretifemale_9246 [Volvox reticuliferus]